MNTQPTDDAPIPVYMTSDEASVLGLALTALAYLDAQVIAHPPNRRFASLQDLARADQTHAGAQRRQRVIRRLRRELAELHGRLSE